MLPFFGMASAMANGPSGFPRKKRRGDTNGSHQSNAVHDPPDAHAHASHVPSAASSPIRPVRLTFANPVQVPPAPIQEPPQLSEEDAALESAFQNQVSQLTLDDFMQFAALPRPGLELSSANYFLNGLLLVVVTCFENFNFI